VAVVLVWAGARAGQRRVAGAWEGGGEARGAGGGQTKELFQRKLLVEPPRVGRVW
jgi:hypothetical protein